MMNIITKRSSIVSSISIRTLISLTSIQSLHHLHHQHDQSLSSSLQNCDSPPQIGVTTPASTCFVRSFHFRSSRHLNFKASFVANADYAAVREDAAEPKGGGEEGLEIAKLGIESEIVKAFAKKRITKLFPIQIMKLPFNASRADFWWNDI